MNLLFAIVLHDLFYNVYKFKNLKFFTNNFLFTIFRVKHTHKMDIITLNFIFNDFLYNNNQVALV